VKSLFSADRGETGTEYVLIVEAVYTITYLTFPTDSTLAASIGPRTDVMPSESDHVVLQRGWGVACTAYVDLKRRYTRDKGNMRGKRRWSVFLVQKMAVDI